MMNKLIVCIVLTLSFLTANAQSVFNEIYNLTYKSATDPKESVEVRKVAAFKLDALSYLKTKVMNNITINGELQDSISGKLVAQLDSQAYYMYDYLNIFSKEYSRAGTTTQKERVMRIFRSASINNPLFNDPDRQLVLAYYNREDYITQFSLDTNWIKALTDAKEKLKK